MDDDDDAMIMPSSKFTNIKKRSETENESTTSNFNATDTPSLNFKRTVKPIVISTTTNNDHKISFDLTDSDSELTDASATCRKTLERLKSSIINLEASTSKTFKDSTCSKESVPSSPDSDSELLKPAFDYYHTQSTSNNLSAKICSKGNFSETFVNKSKDCHIVDSGVEMVRGFKGSSESIQDEEDVCLDEPVKKKKRTREHVEERKREAMVGGPRPGEFFCKQFLMGLYKGGLYIWGGEGDYTWTIFCVSNKQVSHKQENKHVLTTCFD
jgi:hypothetical protein